MIIKEDIVFGLTPDEVNLRIKEGKQNISPKKKTKTYGEIFFKNIFTVFNLVIVVLFSFTVTTIHSIRDLSNLIFVLIALINLVIGISQEIKAKKMVEKLLLVNEAKVKVLRNLDEIDVSISDIVLDDVVVLEAGKQICADATIIQGEVYVNESNLTGESDDVLKKKGDFLYSGSFVVSGEAYCKVIAVGKENYIEKLSAQASKYTKPKSEIMNSLSKIIDTISIALVPISIILFIVYKSYSNYATHDSLVLGLVASINGMIPYGLFLLTTVSLATSVIKLSTNKTLVKELYCIEQLARVDVLCLDKTGTITDGTMTVKDIEILDNKAAAIEIISSMNGLLKGNNQTTLALKKKYGSKIFFKSDSILNFNSTNKFSACHFRGIGTFALGAPEVLIKNYKGNAVLKKVNERALLGDRVLALCKTTSSIINGTIEGIFEPVALIFIRDNIRIGAKDTLREFQENGVEIKIISGDNPITVSAIAKEAEVPNYDKYISLDELSDDEVRDAAKKYTIFGRVKPGQKKILIETLKKMGHKVAMTGDGVNDILALKEADCSIAMAEGSDAAKTVSHLVLLDSNFLSLPKVVNEGRRVINNIQRTAALYLSKTILMVTINLIAIVFYFINPVLEFTSPFKEPSHLIIIETFIIGIPSFFLALEPNAKRIKGRFLANVIKNSLPGAMVMILNLVAIQLISFYFSIDTDTVTNISIIAATFAYFMILVTISVPFSTLRLIVNVFALISSMVSIFVFPKYFHLVLMENTTRNLFLSSMGSNVLLILVGATLLAFGFIILFKLLSSRKKKERKHEAL